jgi:thiol-disulfide isomerase/thioredoxin
MKAFGVVAVLTWVLLWSVGLPPAAAFELRDTQGKTHALAAYKGKWVLLNLWASWCPPCIAELPELIALRSAEKNLVILGLSVDGLATQRLKQLSDKLGVNYPVIAGNTESAKPFQVKVFPTTILYDPAGKQVFMKEGPISRQEIEAVMHNKVP